MEKLRRWCRVPISPAPDFPWQTAYIRISYIVTNVYNSWTHIDTFLLKSILHSDFLSFYLMSHFCSRAPSRTPHNIIIFSDAPVSSSLASESPCDLLTHPLNCELWAHKQQPRAYLGPFSPWDLGSAISHRIPGGFIYLKLPYSWKSCK